MIAGRSLRGDMATSPFEVLLEPIFCNPLSTLFFVEDVVKLAGLAAKTDSSASTPHTYLECRALYDRPAPEQVLWP